MSKYINADEFKSYVKEVYLKEKFKSEAGKAANMCGQMILEYIDSLPSADVVKVKHGEWIENENNDTIKCSVCGFGIIREYCGTIYDNPFKFCPNCGADMRERKETE